jgi:hypothetical protein
MISLSLFAGAALVACGGGSAGASGGAGAGSGLRVQDVRPTLADSPFAIDLRSVKPPRHDDAAFQGTATGPHHTVVKFSIGIGPEAFAVPLPGIGTVHAVSNGAAGFAFNDYASGGGDFKTAAQWNEAVQMVVEMEEKLCRKATGEACPV